MADDLKQQNNNGFQGTESNDSISSFPDSLLHHILSYLPTRGVIRTGVLSKRWKSLWTGVPRLDFDDRWLLYCDSEFLNIVERVLLLRDGTSIEQFRLWFSSYAPPSTYSRVQALIAAAVTHKVQHLDIDVYFATCVQDKFTLPCSIFDSQTLSILKLSMKCILQLPSHVSLPRLKVLHLRDFEFPNAKSIENLFSCCLVLEELTLVRCRWIDQNGIKISIPSLKSLTTDYSLEGCYIKFETPALQSFKYNGELTFPLYLTKMPSIEKFNLCVQAVITAAVTHTLQQLDIILSDQHQFTLPCSIFDCRSLSILKLSMKCTLELPSCISLPLLKVLYLRYFVFPDAKSIENLFSCCPVLEELTLRRCTWINCNSVNISIPSLKSLTMDYYLQRPKSSCYIKVEAPALQSLYYVGNLTLPDNIPLPTLKVMHLHSFAFQNAKSIEKLFSSCLVLEELVLENCKWIQPHNVTISIPSLRKLTLSRSLEADYVKNNYNIIVEAPALRFFNYTGIWSNGLYLTKTISPSSSIKACIDTTEHFFDVDIGRLFKLLQCMDETMVSLTISNVTAKLLSLSVEHKDLGHLPVFHRLTYLGFSVKVQGRVFKRFRKCFHFMPNLGTIEFLKGLHENIRKSGLKGMSKSLPNCFTSSLKILSLKNVFGHSHEMFFLTSFLEKAVSLQRIDIFQHEYIHKDDQVELRNEVEKLSKRFKHCAIKIR